MQDDDRPLSTEALTLLRFATVADLKSKAIETAQFFADLDDSERERLLVLLDL